MLGKTWGLGLNLSDLITSSTCSKKSNSTSEKIDKYRDHEIGNILNSSNSVPHGVQVLFLMEHMPESTQGWMFFEIFESTWYFFVRKSKDFVQKGGTGGLPGKF